MRFVVLSGVQSVHDDDLFCLTPHVMRWSSQVYVMDLASCSHYWKQQAQGAKLELLQLYENIIARVFGATGLAVFCDHPWRGLCFSEHLQQQGISGCQYLGNRFHQQRYRHLPWRCWFETLAHLGEHLHALKAAQFYAPVFKRKTAQLQRFVQRLELHGPYELAQADVQAISRRYSGWIARAWGWSFQPAPGATDGTDAMHGFPWRPLHLREPIGCKRHLDYPVSQWDVVAPLLKDDLARLCEQPGWMRGDKINHIDWTITLFNMRRLRVAISFRHPYSLHAEAPHFKAALYQAYYAYEAMMRSLVQRDTDLDLPEDIPFVSWQLDVGHCLRLPQKVLDLFPEQLPDAAWQQIIDLQNCLPCDIEHYAIRPDFLPEQLFNDQSIGERAGYDFSLHQWWRGLSQRPLFYYPQPLPIEAPAASRLRFIERTADNWWRNGDTQDALRDYYVLENGQGRMCWVFRNHAGEWYQHGLYS